MIKDTSKTVKLCWAVFIIYIIGLSYFTFFAEALGRGSIEAGTAVKRFNLIPFTEIRRFWVFRRELGFRACFLNLAGNVLCFIPCGALLPVISRRCKRALGAVTVGLLISFFIECTQLIFRVGSFDVDDILLNTIGAALGFVLFRLIRSGSDKRRLKERRKHVSIRKVSADKKR